MGNCEEKENINLENHDCITSVKGMNTNNQTLINKNEIQNAISFEELISYLKDNNVLNLSNENANFEIENNTTKDDNYLSKVTFTNNIKKLCLIKSVSSNNKVKIEKLYNQVSVEKKYQFSFFEKCKGYILVPDKVLLIYSPNKIKIQEVILNNSLDLNNKLVIMKNIILAVKKIHDNFLSFESFDIENIEFAGKNFLMKFTNIIYIKTSERLKKKDILNMGFIFLQIFSSLSGNLDDIFNIYIRAFIVGLTRKDISELPSDDNVIEVYNLLIDKLSETNPNSINKPFLQINL